MVTSRGIVPQILPVLDYRLLQTGSQDDFVAFATELRDACTDVGFFYLDIGGSEAGQGEAAAEALAAAQAFFSLPLDVKQQIDIKNSPHFRGYAQIGRETTAHKTDLREQIDFGLEASALPRGCAEAQEMPYLRVLVGPNQWPDERRLPTFRPQLEKWFQICGEIGDKLVEAFALALGLQQTYFAKCGYFTPDTEDGKNVGRHCRMKISHYPPVSETGLEGKAAFDDGSLGVGPHKVRRVFPSRRGMRIGDSRLVLMHVRMVDSYRCCCKIAQVFRSRWTMVRMCERPVVDQVALGQSPSYSQLLQLLQSLQCCAKKMGSNIPPTSRCTTITESRFV